TARTQPLCKSYGLVGIPGAIGVYAQDHFRTEQTASGFDPFYVGIEVAPDLHLHGAKTVELVEGENTPESTLVAEGHHRPVVDAGRRGRTSPVGNVYGVRLPPRPQYRQLESAPGGAPAPPAQLQFGKGSSQRLQNSRPFRHIETGKSGGELCFNAGSGRA